MSLFLAETALKLSKQYKITNDPEVTAFMKGFLAGHAYAENPAPADAVIRQGEPLDIPEDIGG